jgi:hypothetical protein
MSVIIRSVSKINERTYCGHWGEDTQGPVNWVTLPPLASSYRLFAIELWNRWGDEI